MPNSKFKLLAFAFLLILSSTESYAQSSFGVAGGAGVGRLFDLRRDESMEYQSQYNFKGGLNFSAFYQMKSDPVRFELQYLRQKADLNTVYYGGHFLGSMENDLQFTFQQMNLKAMYVFQPVQKEHFQLNILAGVVVGYTFNTASKGSYPVAEKAPYPNGNGGFEYYSYTKTYSKDEKNSDDLTRLNGGLTGGLEFVFPVSERLDLMLQNRYTVYASNFVRAEYTMWASLLVGEVNVGVKFRIGD